MLTVPYSKHFIIQKSAAFLPSVSALKSWSFRQFGNNKEFTCAGEGPIWFTVTRALLEVSLPAGGGRGCTFSVHLEDTAGEPTIWNPSIMSVPPKKFSSLWVKSVAISSGCVASKCLSLLLCWQQAMQRHCGCDVPPDQSWENMTLWWNGDLTPLWRMEMLFPHTETIHHRKANLPC